MPVRNRGVRVVSTSRKLDALVKRIDDLESHGPATGDLATLIECVRELARAVAEEHESNAVTARDPSPPPELIKLTLKWAGNSGDRKRAFVEAEENDGWKALRIEVDTDDCDGDHARKMMQEVIDRCNRANP